MKQGQQCDRKKVHRDRLNFVPEWEGPIKLWSCKIIYKSLFKVQPLCDFDDMLQEGYLVFLRIKNKYAHVSNPAHFMSIYKISFINQINTIAKKELHCLDLRVMVDDVEMNLLEAGYEDANALINLELEEKLMDAPIEVQKVIKAFQSNEYQFKFKRKKGVRETTVEFWKRTTGVDNAQMVFKQWLNQLKGVKV